jgi:regulator of replication initiation timing
MNILFIILGCNVPYLLNDRITTAVQFVEENFNNNTNINWFLSGGIKNPLEDTITEAEKMKKQISVLKKPHDNKWNYIYDTKATNTAENFINVKKYLDNTFIIYSEVFIVTSAFHYDRAKKIAEKIINYKISWVLADAELKDSRYWEKIHIKNVDSDVEKALNSNC